jgi:hypothetical protein
VRARGIRGDRTLSERDADIRTTMDGGADTVSVRNAVGQRLEGNLFADIVAQPGAVFRPRWLSDADRENMPTPPTASARGVVSDKA